MVSDCANEVVVLAEVDKDEDAFAGVEELAYLRDVEAGLEFGPYVWSETVPIHAADVVIFV